MKPYNKSDSFMRRVTKRVSELIPGTTWMNTLLGESQSDNDLTNENNDHPPMKKLCTSNNTFKSTNNRTSIDTNVPISSIDNHTNSYINAALPEISAVNCVPSTSRQSPKFINQSNSSLLCYGTSSNRSTLKRKSEVIDSSNINRLDPKPVNFASSTPTLVAANKLPVSAINLKRSLNADKLSTGYECPTPTTSKIIPKENESQSLLKFRETTPKKISTPSFRWDTFVNYGELTERQKLFALKSPLNCSQVMYGGNSARSNLSKILGNTPPIHKKAVIPISPTNNSEIRTTSSILLGHISTKDKKIEENTFIIQPKTHIKHKAEPKTIPITVETTIKTIDTPSEKYNISRDTSRKLRANISKKARGLKSEEHDMPAKVDLPNITLPVPVLPNIKLFNHNCEANEFTFNQPLTIEQFSVQIAEKTSRKKQKITYLRTQTPKVDTNIKDDVFSTDLNLEHNNSTNGTLKKESEKISLSNKIENVNKKDEILELGKNDNDLKDNNNTSVHSPVSKLESIKPVNIALNSSTKLQESNNISEKAHKEKSVEPKKWVCDTCWVSNDSDKNNCVACQTPKSCKTQKPLQIIESSNWTCGTCWVSNKNEMNTCVACQAQKPGTIIKKISSSTWTCDACWVKNKTECTTCISCGTEKPGSISENKPQSSTQFKFGNNKTFENPGSGQFRFGFDNSKTNQLTSQFKFGSPATSNDSVNDKSEKSPSVFKFGMVENKTDQPPGTFKFGFESTTNQSVKKTNNEVTNISSSDQPESRLNSDLNTTNSKPISQFKFKFGSDNVESDKSIQLNSPTVSKDIQSMNEAKHLINNKNEISENPVELQSKGNLFKFGDTKQTEKSTPQVSFNSIENSLTNNIQYNKNEDLPKEKVELNPMNFGSSQPVQSTITSSTHLVNGHSHSNKEQMPALIKTSQLFSFGSLAKQDQILPDNQNVPKPFTFGSVPSSASLCNKSFVTPTSNCFPSTGPVFGTSTSMFGNGPTTSTSTTSVATPQFSFGSLAPQTTNSFFSKTTNDKIPLAQTSNSFTSITNTGFTFGSQSSPVFSVNPGGFMKPVQADDQPKITSNSLFNQSSAKQIIKLTDPNEPISINFTGGTTTQFTAKPETTEPPTKRKILKPVRRIR